MSAPACVPTPSSLLATVLWTLLSPSHHHTNPCPSPLLQTLDLPRLLAELGVPVVGHASLPRAQALEATRKALRRAKVAFHPDKVGLKGRLPPPLPECSACVCVSVREAPHSVSPCLLAAPTLLVCLCISHVREGPHSVAPPLLAAPDQVTAASGVGAKVRAEEIFKILNSWDLSKL